jgi:ABC-type bacteriocin/lantibiotic exporter with double-glycine peptidase domain
MMKMREIKMKRIIQEDKTGCGLACIAMIAKNVTYSSVKKRAVNKYGFDPNGVLYTQTNHLRELLEEYGVVIGKRKVPFKDWKRLPKLSILGINHKENTNTWHWVIYRRTKEGAFVLDPKEIIKAEKRVDFGRMNPKWYIKCSTD